MRARGWALVCACGAALAASMLPSFAEAKGKRCPSGMVTISGQFCVDPYEGAVEEKKGRKWVMHSPYEPVSGAEIRAVSKKGVFPQGYISRNEAEEACKGARKRLCKSEEWLKACRGRNPTIYPYGDTHKAGYCNDAGVSPLNQYYGAAAAASGGDQSAYGWGPMNDPRLNQLAGSLARTGAFRKCTNGFHVYDMVGNLHEWVDDSGGTFRGGYYLDTKINGEGCEYHTTAHNAQYHDYSTGFRCCADLR